MTPLTSFGMVAPLFPVGQLDVRPDQRLPSITHPTSAPAPSRPKPTLASAVLVAVDVVPSPVAGAGPGTAFTVKVAVAETPLEHVISGLYVPGASELGRTTVATNMSVWLPGCIGIWAGRPSEEPSSVAEVHGVSAPVEQSIVNVVEVPGVDGFGKTLAGDGPPPPASAAGAPLRSTTMISPAIAAVHLARRMSPPMC